MSRKQGFEECEYLLISHMIETLWGKRTECCHSMGYMMGQVGQYEHVEDSSNIYPVISPNMWLEHVSM